ALVARLAGALAAAHNQGVVHRDLKPRNVVVDTDGRPYLIDFGLARLDNAWAEPPRGDPGYAGTPAFTAPAQAGCEADRVGPRGGLFALGGVLYSLPVGKAPFVGKDAAAVLARARRCDFDRAALAKVPRRLRAVCLRALEEDPDRRYQRAEEMA